MDPRLTSRERQVLSLCAEGLSIPEIAEQTGLSPRGAKHVSDVLRYKFNVKNRRELIRIGQSYGKGTQ